MSNKNFEVLVRAKQVEALDICTFELGLPDDGALPAFSAGSHIDVQIGNGITRQYSLCNDPEENHRYLIGVLNDAASRGGSAWMHKNVQPGTRLTISAPKNKFPLARGAKHSILIAGGIGITPLLCMAERLSRTGENFDFHYCARSRARTAFYDRIQSSLFQRSAHFYWDDQPELGALDLSRIVAEVGPDVHVYFCGPQGFMDWIQGKVRGASLPDTQVHFEFFSREVAAQSSDISFEVQLARSGRIVLVQKSETVIQALAAAGVNVEVSCEQGVCGTCLTRVIDGEPEHRDCYLTPAEHAANDQFTPCCSRSRSPRLVLDL